MAHDHPKLRISRAPSDTRSIHLLRPINFFHKLHHLQMDATHIPHPTTLEPSNTPCIYLGSTTRSTRHQHTSQTRYQPAIPQTPSKPTLHPTIRRPDSAIHTPHKSRGNSQHHPTVSPRPSRSLTHPLGLPPQLPRWKVYPSPQRLWQQCPHHPRR